MLRLWLQVSVQTARHRVRHGRRGWPPRMRAGLPDPRSHTRAVPPHPRNRAVQHAVSRQPRCFHHHFCHEGPRLGAKLIKSLLGPITSTNGPCGVPWWLSGLRIWCCYCCGLGSVPGSGISACCRCSQNPPNKNKKQTHPVDGKLGDRMVSEFLGRDFWSLSPTLSSDKSMKSLSLSMHPPPPQIFWFSMLSTKPRNPLFKNGT